MSPTAPLSAYYAWLTALARLERWRQPAPAAVHRRLRSDSGDVSQDVVHDLIVTSLRACGLAEPPVVLDAGCGLGGTILALRSQLGGRYVGVTLSDAQCRYAARAAAALGASADCRFLVRDYDADLTDVLPNGVDVVIAIESLAHAADPTRSIARLAALLRPGGCLLVVDDVPAEQLSDDDPDFEAFRRGWLCPSPSRASDLRRAFERAGLVLAVDDDLTPRVPLRRAPALTRRWRAASWGRRLLSNTPLGLPIASWHGGLALERLYARSVMHYRAYVAQRPRS